MAALGRKKARRDALRSSLNEIIGEASISLENVELEQTKLLSLKVRMESSFEGLNVLDNEIANALDPEEVRDDVLANIKAVEPTYEIFASIQLRLEKLHVDTLQASNSGTERASSSTPSVTKSCRLPKLELPTFKGDVLSRL